MIEKKYTTKKILDEESGKIIEESVMNAITIDCAIFSFSDTKLKILLVQHAKGIRKGEWGLPGGWIMRNEHIDDAANRLLTELSGIKDVFLEQVRAFGDPDRFPLDRVITIGYYALISGDNLELTPGFTASDAKWFNLEEAPKLIYDHKKILDESLKKLQTRVRHSPIGFNLLPEKFTLLQLKELYEAILHIELDKSNFRRKILKMKLLIPLNEKEQNVSHRAAKLYKFDLSVYKRLTEKGFTFEL